MLTNELTGLSAQGQFVFLQSYLLHPYTIAALAAVVYLWILHKEMRWKVLLPLVLIMVMICTPLGYKLSFKRYFRLFWILPRGLLIALAGADLFRRLKNQWLRLAALLLAGGIIVLTGASWFNHESVKPAYTAYKLDKGIPELCDRMLEETPHPKAVFAGPWGPLMARQYSADIELLWGRNAYGFIMPISKEAKKVFKAWNKDPHDWDALLAYMSKKGYDYLGTTSGSQALKDAAEKYQYEKILKSGDYKLFARKGRTVSGGEQAAESRDEQ